MDAGEGDGEDGSDAHLLLIVCDVGGRTFFGEDTLCGGTLGGGMEGGTLGSDTGGEDEVEGYTVDVGGGDTLGS